MWVGGREEVGGCDGPSVSLYCVKGLGRKQVRSFFRVELRHRILGFGRYRDDFGGTEVWWGG